MKIKFSKLVYFYIFIFPFFYFGSSVKNFVLTIIIFLIGMVSYKENKSLINRNFINVVVIISILYLINTLISLLYINFNFDYEISSVLKRIELQIFSFSLVLFEIYLGFVLLNFITKKGFIKIIFISILVTVILSIYQDIAYIKGWPIWGLYLFHNNKYAIDIVTGFRNNALCGEPKYLAVYMAVAFFFILDLNKKYLSNILKYSLLTLILFVFFKTSSGNGIIAFIILLFLKLYMSNRKYFFIILLLIPIIFEIFINTYEYFIFRPSILYILDAIKNLNFNMSYMDDLVYLPWLAWMNYWFMLLFGFGLGLLHFYAANFVEYAKWFKLGHSYIDSNIYLISFISNFGILLTFGLIIYMLVSYGKNIQFFNSMEDNIILNYILYSFFVGLFIGGDLVLFYFISIGIMMFYNLRRRKKII